MSGFIRPWDVNQQAEEQKDVKSSRSMFDNLGDLFSAASANFDDVRGSERLGDLRNELMDSQNLSDDEYNMKRAQYVQEYLAREDARRRYQQAHQNLVDDDSFLQNLDQFGGTAEGMIAQGLGTAGGAALGALASPFTAGGSIAMGAKIGNAAGAVAGGYLDARSVALQAEEEVLEKGGTWEQAKLAYEEALKKASLTTLPETAVDIIMGNRLMRSALGSKAARKIAGSAIGRVGSSVLDPAARLGTKAAFASGKGLVGRGVGLATDIALQGATEAGQEVTQDYIANREVAKALGQKDNEYSLGGFKDYALSDQGLETMKTAGIMGAVFGGAGGVLSSGQYLQRGAETSMGIKAHNATQSMIDDGNLKLDKQKRAEEEKFISLTKGISPAQLATWSDADIIAESSVIRGQYRSLYTGEDSDVAQVREAVDATDRLSKTDNSTTREGDLTERSKTLLDRMGIDNREMFNSPAEKSVIEQAKKANEELQKQANKNEEEQSITTTEKKEGEPAIKANITVNTAEGMAQDENGNITTNDNDATTVTNQAQQVADKSKTDGVIKGFSTSFTGEDIGSFKNNDVQGMNYVNSHEYTNESIGVDILASEIMGNVQLKNMETGKIKPFNSPEEAKQYLVDNQNNKDAFAFQEEKQQSKEEELPENGVDVDTSGHTGQLIQSVDDLYNLAVERPELVSAYDFMEFIRMKQHMGVEGIDIYLNKEKYGYHKDPKTGKYVKVHGYAARAKGKASAFIQLYKSGDLASAVHEIAHIGYWNLNESDKRTFDYYAIKTQGRYIADMLDENYDNNFVNRLVKLVNDVKNNKLDEEDKQLQDRINSHPATRQIQANLIPFYNSVVYNEPININNLTKEQQIAIQERWAWEMSQWYIEGYVKGVEPNNIVERIEQRGCASIAPELNALLRVWEHIHHKDSGIENVYSGEQAVENKQEETSQNLPAIDPIGNIQFTNELQRQAVPNINMPMNFGGEQAIQYNVPTLGESYNVASRMNLPQADNGVETNQTDVVPTVENQNSNIATPKETNSINEDIGNGTFRFGNDLQANPLPINAMQFNNGNDLGETVAGTSFAQKLTFPAENGTVEKNEGGQVNGQTEDTRRGENLPRTNQQQILNGESVRQEPLQGREDKQNVAGREKGTGNSEERVLSDQKEESFGRKILGRIPKALKQAWKGLGCNTKIEDWRVVSGKKEYLQLFSDALQRSIDNNITHGVYVDPMSVDELKDATVILHKSKKAGLVIDRNGTLHGVFKDPSLKIPYIIKDITLIAREMGCVRMDCYGEFLVRGYQTLGFTPVAKLNYTDEYIQDRIKANPKAYETQLKERPTVYVLVRNEDSNEVARNKIANGGYEYYSDKELGNLPLFKDKDVGYDSAISYGDSSAQIKKKLGKKFNERAVVMATEDARNYYNTISEQPKQVLDAVLNRIKGSLSASKNEYGYPFLLELQKAIEGGETNDSQQLNKEELQSRIDEINKEIDEFVNEDNTKITKEDKEHSQNFESFSNSYIREGKIFREISGFPEDSKPKTKTSKTTQSNKQNLTPTSQLKELKVENGRVVQQETEEEDENAVNNEMAQATPDRVTEKKSENKDSSKKKFTTNDALKRIRERAKKNNPSTTLKEGVTKKEYDIFKKTGKLPEKQEQSIQITDPVLRDWVDRFTNNGVFDFNEASTELYKELDKGNITQKEYDKLMNDFMEYVENKEELSSQGQKEKGTKVYQEGNERVPSSGNGSPTSIQGSERVDNQGGGEKQERAYQESADRIIRFMGVSLDRKAGSVSSRDMEQEFRKELKRLRIPDYVYFRFIHPDKVMFNTKKDKNAKRFIKALMKINEKLFENGNVYRGLDGKWRYWIDDRNATFDENVFDLIDNFITMKEEDIKREDLTIEDLGLGDEVYKLSEVLNHDEFFKLCPEASDVTVQFTTPEWDRDLEGYGGYYLDGKIVINLNTLRAASNIAEEGLRRKLLRRWLMGVLLHETQHFVQHEDQFARGFNESGFMQVLNDKSRVPDVVDLLIEYKDKILKDEDDKTRYGGIFNNKERLEQLLSSDDYEDYWRQVEIAGMVRKSKLPMDFYYRSLGEEEARFTGENWSEGTTEEKYYIGGESFDLEEVSTAGYLTENGEFEFVDLDENISDIPKLKERLAKAIKFSQNNIKELQADLKRLQNSTEETDGGVVSRDEALNMTKDEIKSAREEIKVCKKILQKLKEGKEIVKREEEIKPKVPMNSEEYFKDLTSEDGDYVHIDKRFQEADINSRSQQKAQQAQEILNSAFPDVRFQYAWHSTPHDFDKFTLKNLLSGEGCMAHGYGLYFSKSLKLNKKRYFNMFNKKKHKQLLFNGQDYSQQLEEMYIKAYDNWSVGREIRDIIEGYGSIKKLKESIDSSIHNARHSLKSNKQFLKDITGENRGAFEQILGNGFDRTVEGLKWSIEHDKGIINGLEKVQKILNDKNFEVKESSANILLVDIPEDNVLLREDAIFDKQPKYVQKQLLRMFEKSGRRSRREGLTKNFINKLKNTTDIYGFVADYFGSEEDASLSLSEYGIKGISYRGEIDGECAVIFDADAINILNKFKQEEKKFVSQQKKDRENKQRQKALKEAAEKIEDLLGIRFQEASKQLTDEEIEAMDKREEKEYNKRKERVEKADNAGELSDVVKDVYSVTFTKSAQNFAENRTRMEYFDNRDKYWDRSEKDGKVTYTRKTPLEHHKKVITYNGANELMQEDKKKSKPEQWLEWAKDRIIKYAFNDMHFLAKAARKLGKYDAYVKMIVTKGYALKANTAMQRGIKYNGKYTRALNDIIKEIGEEKQKDFIEYCIAKRVIDLSKRDVPVYQDMKPDEAAELIKKYESGADAKLFMKNQKDFVEYNKALLHVLVDSGIHTEEEFQKLIEVDPNFVPLTKVMDDADMGFNSIQAARSIVNVKTPLKRIGTSFRKVKNPFLEMQKRTAEYYAIASRNKAGQIFVNEIANALDKKANGDTIAKGQGMIRQVSVDEKDGNLITKPDDKQQIIYVCNNGKHEFYQVSDPEIYRALKALDADQMGTIQKMIDPFLHAPSALIRETATMVPDFGVRNLLRDGGEAFLTSEHGFLPFIDQIWGMYQMANNTEWYQRFLEQKGEYGTYNRENANDGVARIEDTIDEKVNPIKNFNEIRNAALQKLTNKKNSKATRAVALLQLMGSMPYAVIKSNKRLNDYLEMGTRIGEFKNAKMGYNGTLDRLSRGGILDWNPNLNKAKQDDILAAGAAKEITLNFEQYGIIGKQLNRYIPFFNATLQGIYKMCNALELMATGTTLSGQKNRTLQSELIFKAALITAIGIGVAAAGEGDDDYEEANQYEKENFWILPNGLRFPKDQVLGKLFGNVAEKSYTQWRKGKFEPSDILRSIKENFTPDKFIPALAEIALGGMYNYDTFYKSAIVPEYMQGKLGHLQKDLATSNMASDVSDFLWKYTRTDVSAKRLDWALQKNLTNCKKYIDAIYDLGKKAYDPKSFNEKMARGYDKGDSTGAFVGGLKDDIPKPLSLVTGTFATNRTNYKSISDFYERYNDLKKLATDEQSMSKEDKRAWKRYEQAYKKDKVFRKELRAIKGDSSLTGKQKREKADKIFKQQIKLAKWAEG